MGEGLAQEVDGAAEVDVEDEVEVVEGEGVAVTVDDLCRLVLVTNSFANLDDAGDWSGARD